VQPTLALGLVLLLFLGKRLLHEPVGAVEWAAVAAIVAAMGLLAWAAPPEHAQHAAAAKLALGLVPLGVVALAPYALRKVVAPTGVMLSLAAGAAYAWTGLSSKLLVDDLRAGVLTGIMVWTGGTVVLGLTGLASEMAALQRRAATQVGPLVFVVQTVVPVLLAPFLGGENWGTTPLGGAVILAAVGLVAAAAFALGRSRAVAVWLRG
jgi:drug/metabolite transporter (DMT)-like permease